MPHHVSCWEENHGCTTFGCAVQQQEVTNGTPQNQNTINMTPHAQSTYTEVGNSYIRSAKTFAQTDLMSAIRRYVAVLTHNDLVVALPFVFFVIGILLVLTGIFYHIPSSEVYGGSFGDPAIRGGEIAGAHAAKAFYICGGMLLSAFSVFKIQSLQGSSSTD
jgi:hypothetical protein